MSASLFIGHRKKSIAHDYPQYLLDRSGVCDRLLHKEFFLSLYRGWSLLKSVLLNKQSKILIVVKDEELTPLLDLYYGKYRGQVFFINYKWIPGFFSNSSVVRYNIERFYVDGSDYSTRSRRKTCLKMYRGLQGFTGRPDLIVGLGGKELDIMLTELSCLRYRIPHIVTRDTNNRMVRSIDSPIFLNDDLTDNVKLVLRLFFEEIDRQWTK